VEARAMTGTPSNRRPADRLAEIRQQLAVLKAEEALLRAGLISGTLPLAGYDYSVEIEEKINERIDSRALRQNVPETICKPFLIATPTVRVAVKRKNLENATRTPI
jgi:hypothetical protein